MTKELCDPGEFCQYCEPAGRKVKTPVDRLLAKVEWKPIEDAHLHDDGTYPYATHEGMFDFYGVQLRCYQLSNGQRVVNAEDIAMLGRSLVQP